MPESEPTTLNASASREAARFTGYTPRTSMAVPIATPAPRPLPGAAAPPATWAPPWLKGVVIGGVLLAIAMPVSVLLSRSMLVQAALGNEANSRAAMVCTAGQARARDDSSLSGWLFGGSYFQCGDWETREARQQRERDQAHANYMARERARLQGQ